MATLRTEFEDLFRLEFDRCVAVARRILVDGGAAEETAAEAFTRAWSRWRRVRRFASPGGWVVRVTTNLALDQWRRGPAPLGAASRFDPTALDEAVVVHVALLAAIGQLPERQRTAVSLRYFADLPVDDVAGAMGVSAGSVKTHLHRGLERLRTTLAVDEPALEAHLAARP